MTASQSFAIAVSITIAGAATLFTATTAMQGQKNPQDHAERQRLIFILLSYRVGFVRTLPPPPPSPTTTLSPLPPAGDDVRSVCVGRSSM